MFLFEVMESLHVIELSITAYINAHVQVRSNGIIVCHQFPILSHDCHSDKRHMFKVLLRSWLHPFLVIGVCSGFVLIFITCHIFHITCHKLLLLKLCVSESYFCLIPGFNLFLINYTKNSVDDFSHNVRLKVTALRWLLQTTD